MNYIFRTSLLSFLITSCGGSDNSDTEGPQLLTKLILKNSISQGSNTEVWRWSDGMSFIQSRTELVIPEGKSIEIWNQELSGDETISMGRYTAFGSFLDQSLKAQVDFTIH